MNLLTVEHAEKRNLTLGDLPIGSIVKLSGTDSIIMVTECGVINLETGHRMKSDDPTRAVERFPVGTKIIVEV